MNQGAIHLLKITAINIPCNFYLSKYYHYFEFGLLPLTGSIIILCNNTCATEIWF